MHGLYRFISPTVLGTNLGYREHEDEWYRDEALKGAGCGGMGRQGQKQILCSEALRNAVRAGGPVGHPGGGTGRREGGGKMLLEDWF